MPAYKKTQAWPAYKKTQAWPAYKKTQAWPAYKKTQAWPAYKKTQALPAFSDKSLFGFSCGAYAFPLQPSTLTSLCFTRDLMFALAGLRY